MAGVVPPSVRSRMMAAIRSRDTKPELLVRRYLHARGFRYLLSPRHLPGKPDLVLPRHKVAIFVHGCFWHGHTGCRFATVPATRTEFWQAKIAGTKSRDVAAALKLREQDWRVAVVWECALKSNSSLALGRIAEFIASSQNSV